MGKPITEADLKALEAVLDDWTQLSDCTDTAQHLVDRRVTYRHRSWFDYFPEDRRYVRATRYGKRLWERKGMQQA